MRSIVHQIFDKVLENLENIDHPKADEYRKSINAEEICSKNEAAQVLVIFSELLAQISDHLLGQVECEETLAERCKEFVMRSMFPSMSFSAEADKLLESLDMSKLVILNPEGDLERDSIAIFTYSEEIKKYVYLSYSEEMAAYKVFMLSDRMADDVDTAVRK